MEEWLSLYNSKSGECGVFNRQAAINQATKYGRRIVDDWQFGTNPCGEIILRPRGLCNLSEIVCRATDTIEDLKRKVRYASILGTFQSTLTNFKYVTGRWKENADEERLLGVSLTGIHDNPYTNGSMGEDVLKNLLNELRLIVLDVNKEFAKAIGIPESAAATTVKPSGTVSQLVHSASGIHTRHAPHYFRRVRGDKKDPLTQMMIDVGFPVEDETTKPDQMSVFTFPIESPDTSKSRNDMTAIDRDWETNINHHLS